MFRRSVKSENTLFSHIFREKTKLSLFIGDYKTPQFNKVQVRKQAFQWYKQTLKFVEQTLSNRKRFIDGQGKQMLEFSCFLLTQNPRILPTGPDFLSQLLTRKHER